MDAPLELSARLAEILNAQGVPAIVIDKLREIKVEVSDFLTFVLTRRLGRITVGLAAHARDLGGFFQLLKLEGVSHEVAMRIAIFARRIWSECESALAPTKPVGLVGVNPTVNSIIH